MCGQSVWFFGINLIRILWPKNTSRSTVGAWCSSKLKKFRPLPALSKSHLKAEVLRLYDFFTFEGVAVLVLSPFLLVERLLVRLGRLQLRFRRAWRPRMALLISGWHFLSVRTQKSQNIFWSGKLSMLVCYCLHFINEESMGQAK